MHIYEYLAAFEILSGRNLLAQDRPYLPCKEAPAAPFLLFPPFSLSALFLLTLRVGSFGAPPTSEMRCRRRRKKNMDVLEAHIREANAER